MDAIVERCCGLDVHQASVVACLLTKSPNGRRQREIRKFGTTTSELTKLREWLVAEACTHVGMESTGVYWMPVYAVLEGAFVLIVGNAAHMKNVPGRKTDVKDAEWIAELVRHGLIRRSFVPPKWQRDLRDLVRYRRKLIETQAAERNRLLKVLEIGNIKLSSVASNVFGASGRAMVEALIEGKATPREMAKLARGTMKRKSEALELALEGRIEAHHRELMRIQLERVERTEDDVASVDKLIKVIVAPHQDAIDRLVQIPGLDWGGVIAIIAELGLDMSVFPTAGHAAAWAGVCPGNAESAGKNLGAGRRKGNIHLTTALVQAATAASRKKGSYLKDKYFRLRARRGHKRALMAVAHQILSIVYVMIRNGERYEDLGDGYLDKRSAEDAKNRMVRRLEALGYNVEVKAPAAGVS
jgi:transposase